MSHAMAFFNPIQLIATLFLALVALPLAFLACITTWLACWILVTRLLFVYAELAWEIVRYTLYDRWRPGHYIESPSVSRRSSRAVSPIGSPPRSPEFSSFKGAPRSRRRAGSLSSTASTVPRVAFSALLEPNPNALERDFEGLGGWVIHDDGADKADEQAWDTLNPRLETVETHRHHSRAHTVATPFSSGDYTFGSPARSGMMSVSHSPERLTTTGLSPRSPGSRTPTRTRGVGPLTHVDRSDSYFPLQAQLRKIAA